MKQFLIVLFVFFGFYSCITAQVNISPSTEKVQIEGKYYYIHIVKPGHTLYSISRAYNTDLNLIVESNPGIENDLRPEQILRIPIQNIQEPKAVEYITHIVKQGETLFSLLRLYNISREEFDKLNPEMISNSALSINQELKFLKQDQKIELGVIDEEPVHKKDTSLFIYHELLKGETIFSLSQKYGVTRVQILNSNTEVDEENLSIGQIILIPRIHDAAFSDRQRLIDSLAKANFDVFKPQEEIVYEITEEIDYSSPCDSLIEILRPDKIKVLVLLPFEASLNLEQFSAQSRSRRDIKQMPISENMTNFYFGSLLALDSFKNTGVKIEYEVYDIGKSNSVLSELIANGTIDKADIILGPAFRTHIEYLAQNRKTNKAIIVLPFSEDNLYVEQYSNIFMAKTSAYYQGKVIADYIKTLQDVNVLVVHENNDISKIYAQTLVDNINIDKFAVSAKRLLFDGTSISGLTSALSQEKENIVILTFKGEYKTFRIFTALFPLKEYNIRVLGDKTMVDYETIDPKFYMDVNFTCFSPSNIDYNKENVKRFVSNYRTEFLSEPDENSFLAYDITKLFISAIIEYGTNYVGSCISQVVFPGVSGNLEFNRESDFRKGSYGNRMLYFYGLNKNYHFEILYPLDSVSKKSE